MFRVVAGQEKELRPGEIMVLIPATLADPEISRVGNEICPAPLIC